MSVQPTVSTIVTHSESWCHLSERHHIKGSELIHQTGKELSNVTAFIDMTQSVHYANFWTYWHRTVSDTC
jgi:hypothetical protein